MKKVGEFVMRRFHSYGPVNSRYHFCVQRKELVNMCSSSITGKDGEDGHYFTIWAPRQTGKTWLMQQVKNKIEEEFQSRFILGTMSMQGVVLKEEGPEDGFLNKIPKIMLDAFNLEIPVPPTWEDWALLFHKSKGLFNRPVILFIDEFDSLPPKVIDRLVTLFREMYLNRKSYLIHGLALIGVRAVLGIESERGSPFNIQRSLHVPNFAKEEVEELFGQYIEESGQKIEPEVVAGVYESISGQPGLVCWFGELLTEKYNPGSGNIIDMTVWKRVYRRACNVEWNNTLLNLIKKAEGRHKSYVLNLFTRSDMHFTLRAEWCRYLYLNGIIDFGPVIDEKGEEIEICRFSSPFVQTCLYNALTDDLIGDRLPILSLDPLDELEDVFSGKQLNLPALLHRYKDYLTRLQAKDLNPWKDQPRRSDLHLTEAVGHFHLYAWLKEVVDDLCVVSPEFPTGNGKVDLHLSCGEKRGIIEVKSFKKLTKVKKARKQAARYARSLGIDSVTIALFAPVDDEDVLEELSGQEEIEGIGVTVVAIGWV